ncbi:hypothetical protein DPMN_021553 [Dreissena polymorpha]|uniref:Uncharacterized protein n=1 Tax=Dreissena polymorpha TaxID=45954 RepID=A0A9D4NKZ8_DREPO|nr:hypothetical protein DPMN_021553 [Dreissena polymorpha]
MAVGRDINQCLAIWQPPYFCHYTGHDMTGTSLGTGPGWSGHYCHRSMSSGSSTIGDRSGHRSKTGHWGPARSPVNCTGNRGPVHGAGQHGPLRSPDTMDRSGHLVSGTGHWSEEEVHYHRTILLLFRQKTHHHQRPATIDTIG